jgi:glycosyltransferase involved in cell wall biosynthesis
MTYPTELPKILGLTFGDPFSAKTYSGVPYHLFQELEKHGCLTGRLNSNQTSQFDAVHGIVDWHRTMAAKRIRRNAFWRYLPENMARLTSRIESKLKAMPEFDVAFQVGVAGIPKFGNFLAAHVEISVSAAATLPVYSENYGFARSSRRFLSRAVQGEKNFLDACDLVWTNSEWTAETFAEYGIPREKLFVHAPGCNVPDPGLIERDWESPHVLFVGKDWVRKGGPELIEAFRILRSRHPDARLTVIGCDPKLDEPGVTTFGFVDVSTPAGRKTISDAYHKATVFCMPSSWESVGLVYMEAALHGLPLIMLAGQGREKIFPPSMSITLKDSNVTDLADALFLLASDPDLSHRMGRAGREHVLENYSWPVVASRFLRAIELKRKHSSHSSSTL